MAVIDPWIDAELRNWGRWCHSGQLPHPMPPTHCRSIEHRYIAPSDLGRELDAEEIARRIPIIRDRAEIVHRVYLRELSERERAALKILYVRRVQQIWQAARMVKIPVRQFEIALSDAGRRVGKALHRGG